MYPRWFSFPVSWKIQLQGGGCRDQRTGRYTRWQEVMRDVIATPASVPLKQQSKSYIKRCQGSDDYIHYFVPHGRSPRSPTKRRANDMFIQKHLGYRIFILMDFFNSYLLDRLVLSCPGHGSLISGLISTCHRYSPNFRYCYYWILTLKADEATIFMKNTFFCLSKGLWVKRRVIAENYLLVVILRERA